MGMAKPNKNHGGSLLQLLRKCFKIKPAIPRHHSNLGYPVRAYCDSYVIIHHWSYHQWGI